MNARHDGEVKTLARTPYRCPLCGCGTELCEEINEQGAAWKVITCDNAALWAEEPCLLFLPRPSLKRATQREAIAAWVELCAAIERSRETTRASLPPLCDCIDGVCLHPITAGGPPQGVRCQANTVANLSEDER